MIIMKFFINRAIFAHEIKRMFTLDSLSDNICVYQINSVLEKRISSKSLKQKKDIVINDFDWSNKQQRVSNNS